MSIDMNAKAEAQVEPDDAKAKELKFAESALSAITAREHEFETGWWVRAKEIQEIYEVDEKRAKTAQTPYNILYSNTEVLLPSLYSATPKPDVRARFKKDLKPLPDMVNRYLTIAADPASPGGDTFDNAMSDAVLSALVPGIGYVRVRYIENRSFPITYESGLYNSIIWGKAPRWSKVPWVAFKSPMKRETMLKQFNIPPERHDEYIPSSSAEDEKDDCVVWEFWDKNSRQVYFLCEEWRDKVLRVTPDPLGMENFYPTPGLLDLTPKSGKIKPTPLYAYYENQAQELNRVTVRLNKVLNAIRVRGAYNGLLGDDLKALLASDQMENEMIAASEAALLAQSGGFDKHIWMLPIEKFIEVANQLYKAREAIKQVIYELTGISDIIRGSSVASETATAQDLKNKWGTVRLRRMQSVVANYARDLFRMTIDCSSDHVPPEKWKQITQMDVPLMVEKQAAQQQLMFMQQSQMPLMPGMPPPPPNPKIQQLTQVAQSPSVEELLAKIKNDQSRTYVINIQTSSTIDLDTAQDKAEVAEFMAALGQVLPGLQGLAALGPTGLNAAKAILMGVVTRYKFGIDIADVIAMIEPPPPQDNGEKEKLQKEVAQKQAEFQKREDALKTQEAGIQKQIADAQLKQERETMQAEFSLKEQQLQIREQIILAKAEIQALIRDWEAEQKIAAADQKTTLERHSVQQEKIANSNKLNQEKQKLTDKTKQKAETSEKDDKILTDLSGVMEKLTNALTAKKTVKDSKGKTYTVEVGN